MFGLFDAFLGIRRRNLIEAVTTAASVDVDVFGVTSLTEPIEVTAKSTVTAADGKPATIVVGAERQPVERRVRGSDARKS